MHRGARRFRAAVERVARAHLPGRLQARIDIKNFYDTNPMAGTSWPTESSPVVRLVEFSRTLEQAVYRRIRLKFSDRLPVYQRK